MGAVGSGRAPRLHVGVTPGGGTLPIARVPNLAEGDRISIKLDLPERQGARMLLVAAFLRGATNPPTKDWFFKSKPWTKRSTELSLTVPAGAPHTVRFPAPDEHTNYNTHSRPVRDNGQLSGTAR